jgi:AcrR family transcriptional regulator
MEDLMDVLHSVTTAMISMLSKKPYNKITVQDLCNESFTSRRTFYKYFADKEAVARTMIREDFVEPVIAMRSIMVLENIKSATLLLTERCYQAVLDKSACYLNLHKNMGKPKLLYMILEENYLLGKGIFKKHPYPESEMDYAAWIMASVTATTVVRWIEDGFVVAPSRLASLYVTWVMSHWRELGLVGGLKQTAI